MGDILLESGTNELEILEFEVGNTLYGINVAKVVEVSTPREVREVPNTSDLVEGIFVSRGEVVSVINLFKFLGVDKDEESIKDARGKVRDMFITCGFNQTITAFHVGKVHSIRRISWSDIKEPPRVANTSKNVGNSGTLTGVVQLDDKLILILDFEYIVSSINKESGLDTAPLQKLENKGDNFKDCRIIVADDSAFLNAMIVESLHKVGFKNIVSFKNGLEAWEYVQANGVNSIACVVSDIEMPQMDGLALTKNIKNSSEYKGIPVLLFSSLINEQMIAKCKSVGADGQFSKPQITNLIEELMKILQVR